MTKSPSEESVLSPSRRRRVIQILFVFINLALVEVHLPGPLWLAIGAIFWIALIALSISGSSLVCGTMCWIGAIQDIFEPFARPRVTFDARFGRAITLTLLIVWMPIGWLIVPELSAHDRTPLDLNLAWERHVFQFAVAALTAGSVVLLGKRGICRYLCPFNSIVGSLRRIVARMFAKPAASAVTVTQKISCASACAGCSRHLQGTAFEGTFQ